MRRLGRCCGLVILAMASVLAGCQPGQGVYGPAPLDVDTTVQRAAGNGDFELARRSLAAGDLSVAKTAFAAALRKFPNDPAVVIGMADTHFALGEYAAAQQIYEVLARRTSEFQDRVDQGLGLIALRKGQNEQAATYLNRSVQRNGQLWRAWLGLGQAHARRKEMTAARRAFSSAERTAPVQAAVVNDIGMSYLHDKQPDRAMEYFKRALSLDPSYHTARANMRIAQAMQGQYDAAVAGAPPTALADVLNNVGYVAILNRDLDVADRLLRRAMAVSPVYHAAAAANLNLLAEFSRSGPGRQVAAKSPTPALTSAEQEPPRQIARQENPNADDKLATAATRRAPLGSNLRVKNANIEPIVPQSTIDVAQDIETVDAPARRSANEFEWETAPVAFSATKDKNQSKAEVASQGFGDASMNMPDVVSQNAAAPKNGMADTKSAIEVGPLAPPSAPSLPKMEPSGASRRADGFVWEAEVKPRQNAELIEAAETASDSAFKPPAAKGWKDARTEKRSFTWQTENGLRTEPAPIPDDS